MHPTKESLAEIVQAARQGHVVLPEFQRSFIWDRRAIEELLVSVFNEYFIGSLLTLNVTPDSVPFRARTIEGIEGVPPHPQKMVLDGQQRITSIHYALYGPDINLKNTSYPYRFFVDIAAALDDRWEEAVISLPTYYKSVPPLFDEPQQQYERGFVALSALRSFKTWMNWYLGLQAHLTPVTESDQSQLDRLMELATKFLTYQVALIEMPQATPMPTVVEVFERINRTGRPLGIFELLTARLWKDGVQLRDLWDGALTDHPRLAAIAGPKSERYPKFALQVVALFRGRECKRKDLILLEAESFVEDWERAVAAIDTALERMHSSASGGYGVVAAIDPPYSTMTTPLAVMLDHVAALSAGSGRAFEKLHYWYWSSVFRERYGGSTETVSQRDFNQLKRWIDDDRSIPEAVPTHEDQIQRDLVEVVRAGAVYRGVLSLVALRGARDFFSGDTIELHELDDHHIFPTAFLKSMGVSPDRRNTILNRTLISSDTNRRLIGAKRPSAYLKLMETQLGREKVRNILASHFVNDAAIEAMRADDFDSFLTERDRTLRAEVIRRCVYSRIGALVSPDEGFAPGQEGERLDRLECAIRDVIDEGLHEIAGESYWKRHVPPDTRAAVARRLEDVEKLHPRGDGGRHITNRRRLDFCDFSDYEKVILQKNSWPAFEIWFSRRGEFGRHITSARRYRNALKHGRDIEPVERLNGQAAILWLERAIGHTRFTDRVTALEGEGVTIEDCLRVLTRRDVPTGQRQLYEALLEAGSEGASAAHLVKTMGRRDESDLAGVLGALGRRINGTPGYGQTNRPGTAMVLEWAEGADGRRYRLRTEMIQALRELAPAWLSHIDVVAAGAAMRTDDDRRGESGAVEASDLTQNQRLQLDFWVTFRGFVNANSQTLVSQEPSARNWTGYAIGRSGFSLSAVASMWDSVNQTWDGHELRAELVIAGEGSHERFDALLVRRQEVEDKLGFELIWQQTRDVVQCRAYVRRSADLLDRDAWPDYQAWLLKHLHALDGTFRPLVAEL